MHDTRIVATEESIEVVNDTLQHFENLEANGTSTYPLQRVVEHENQDCGYFVLPDEVQARFLAEIGGLPWCNGLIIALED